MDHGNKLIMQIDSLTDLVEHQLSMSFENVEECLSFSDILNVRRVIITGSGDSYASGIALKKFFEKYGDTFGVDIVRQIYFTRYVSKDNYEKDSPGSTLLIGISNGGESSRTVEALSVGNDLGYLTLAITNNKESRCAKLADRTLLMDLAKPEYVSVGLRSYLAMLFSLTALVVKFGRVRGIISSMYENNVKKEILELFKKYNNKYEDYKTQAKKIAEKIYDSVVIDFIADDSHLASAYFIAAKFSECTGKLFSIEESETWCHLHAYLKAAKPIPTFILAHKDQGSYSRLIETAAHARKIGRDVYVMGDINIEDFEGCEVIKLPHIEKGSYQHIYYEYIPASLIVGYVQNIVKTDDFCTKKHLQYGTTRSSKVLNLETIINQ